jgi:hypothetical protein
VIAFEHEGTELVLFLDGTDPGYYQLAITYGTEGVPADAATLLGCANALNDRARVVKVVVDLEGEAASFLVDPPMADLETTKPDEAKPGPSLATRVADLLAEEGYRPHLQEPEGRYRRIFFRAEGERFAVRLDEQDPDFVTICLGYLFEEPVPDVQGILRAGHDVQAEAKVAKFFLDPEGKYYELQAEPFLGGHPLNPRHLERSINVLRRAAASFASASSSCLGQKDASATWRR